VETMKKPETECEWS